MATVALYAVATAPSQEVFREVAPIKTAVPTAFEPTPTATPLAPTPTPVPVASEPWTFSSANLSIPDASLEGGISEYVFANPDDLSEDIDPPTLQSISWDSTIPGGILSGSATNTVYLYCHSWLDTELYPDAEPAICNKIRTLQPGAIATITTPTETLTYKMEEPSFPVLKPELRFNPQLKEPKAGRLVVITCNRPSDYDPNAPTVANAVAIFQLVA